MFSVVCLFVQWGSHLTITYDALDLTKQPSSPPPLNRDPPPTPLLLTSGGQDGKHFQPGLHEVVTCGGKTGDMLKLVHLRNPPPPERGVRILLECLLVMKCRDTDTSRVKTILY